MEGSYPGNLRVWDGWTRPTRHAPEAVDGRAFPGPHQPRDFAARLYACEALYPYSAGESEEPFSLQWYLDIEQQRHGRDGRWIPKLLEFAKHAGETLLGLGNGLGTDWLQYARCGASVIVCSPSAQQLALTRRNFELRGLTGRFLHAAPATLPLESATIDVVCVSGLLQDVDDVPAVIEEIYRVLKPGGKVLAVAPARRDVDYWASLFLPWRRWRRGQPATPTVRFTARGLKRLFNRFIEHRVHKRQLRRKELPQLWRWAPRSLMERLMGRVLVLKAFKPVSAAVSRVPLAA